MVMQGLARGQAQMNPITLGGKDHSEARWGKLFNTRCVSSLLGRRRRSSPQNLAFT